MSEKNFRCATLQKSRIEKATENDFYTCAEKFFCSPSLVNFLLWTQLLKISRIFTPPPNPRPFARALSVSAQWENDASVEKMPHIIRVLPPEDHLHYLNTWIICPNISFHFRRVSFFFLTCYLTFRSISFNYSGSSSIHKKKCPAVQHHL